MSLRPTAIVVDSTGGMFAVIDDPGADGPLLIPCSWAHRRTDVSRAQLAEEFEVHIAGTPPLDDEQERFALIHCGRCGSDEMWDETDEVNVWRCKRCGFKAPLTSMIRDVVWATYFDQAEDLLRAAASALNTLLDCAEARNGDHYTQAEELWVAGIAAAAEVYPAIKARLDEGVGA